MKAFIIIIVTLTTIQSCQKDGEIHIIENNDKEISLRCNCDTIPTVNPILYQKWLLENIEMTNGETITPPNNLEELTLTFIEENKVLAFGSMNTLIGSFKTYSNRCINIDGFGGTEVGPGSEEQQQWESRFKKALKSAECYNYNSEENRLIISYKKNNKYNIMNFSLYEF